MKPFRAVRGGDVVARLDPAEAGVVGLLLDQLEQLLEADADDVGGDPVMARLLPDGHRGDPELAADYRDATVVTLYLLPDVNLRLRPKLLSDLKPGTRVVSHNYDMGDWKPLKTITIKLPDGDHTVYFWVVPPRAAGK